MTDNLRSALESYMAAFEQGLTAHGIPELRLMIRRFRHLSRRDGLANHSHTV